MKIGKNKKSCLAYARHKGNVGKLAFLLFSLASTKVEKPTQK